MPDTLRNTQEDSPRYRLYSLCPCAVCQNTGRVRNESNPTKFEKCENCRGEGKVKVRVAEADTPQALGVALVTCAREGAWADGCQFGLLDTEGEVGLKWLVPPWQASPTARNASDAAKVLAGKRWK